jgi:formylglycine-generating enzyme required for sulfatase activity
MMKKQNIKYFLNGQNYFFYLSVIIIMEFVTGMCLSPSCNASMGSVTIETINSVQINCSDYIKISRTTLKTLASQQRKITINDVSGILMVTGFSNILTSTTLNSSHNGVVLVSGNTTLTLPDPTSAKGIRYTIKKIDSSSNIVTIVGIVDSESNPQLSKQYSYITIVSNGNSWYKVAEYIEAQTSSEDYTYISNSLGMTFRLIPSGTFVMGSPTGELGQATNETQYTVTLSESFYIQTAEVTQGQWLNVMNSNPSSAATCGHNCPVENISWNDAQTFIVALNAMGEGSYTLPTEAQWEYAARAGSNTAFANGGITETTSSANLDVMGWYVSNSDASPHAIAQKKANAWGLFDMHGNVLEWCNDWYDTYPTGSVTDPVGPSSGSERVRRGCGFNNEARHCRSAYRYKSSPGTQHNSFGLRLVWKP